MAFWSEVTALFGGTFDPPHLGHLQAVAGLFERPGVKRVVVLPSGTPPLKGLQLLDTETRLLLTKIAFTQDIKQAVQRPLRELEVSDFEIKRAARTPGRPTYTIDTLLELGQIYGEKLAFVLGTDQLSQLHLWHRFPEVLAHAHWIVLKRKPHGDQAARTALAAMQGSGLLIPLSATIKGTRDPLYSDHGETFEINLGQSVRRALVLVDTEAQAVSSTTIREAISSALTPQLSSLLTRNLSPGVLAHLKDKLALPS